MDWISISHGFSGLDAVEEIEDFEESDWKLLHFNLCF